MRRVSLASPQTPSNGACVHIKRRENRRRHPLDQKIVLVGGSLLLIICVIATCAITVNAMQFLFLNVGLEDDVSALVVESSAVQDDTRLDLTLHVSRMIHQRKQNLLGSVLSHYRASINEYLKKAFEADLDIAYVGCGVYSRNNNNNSSSSRSTKTAFEEFTFVARKPSPLRHDLVVTSFQQQSHSSSNNVTSSVLSLATDIVDQFLGREDVDDGAASTVWYDAGISSTSTLLDNTSSIPQVPFHLAQRLGSAMCFLGIDMEYASRSWLQSAVDTLGDVAVQHAVTLSLLRATDTSSIVATTTTAMGQPAARSRIVLRSPIALSPFVLSVDSDAVGPMGSEKDYIGGGATEPVAWTLVALWCVAAAVLGPLMHVSITRVMRVSQRGWDELLECLQSMAEDPETANFKTATAPLDVSDWCQEVWRMHHAQLQLFASIEECRVFVPPAMFLPMNFEAFPSSPQEEMGDEMPMPPEIVTTMASTPSDGSLVDNPVSLTLSPPDITTATRRRSSNRSAGGGYGTPTTTSGFRRVFSMSATVAGGDARLARLKETFKTFPATFLCADFIAGYAGSPTSDSISREASGGGVLGRGPDFVRGVLDTLEECDGVPVNIGATRILASWNAFKPCHSHEATACRTALTVRSRALAEGIDVLVTVVTGNVVVGFGGTSRYRTPLLLGEVLSSVDAVATVSRLVGGHVITTDTVVSRIGNRFNACPVDVIGEIETSGTLNASTSFSMVSTTTLYELLPNTLHVDQSITDSLCLRFNEGFSALLTRDLSRAASMLCNLVRDNAKVMESEHMAHALRIAGLCIAAEDEESPLHLPSPYCRERVGWCNLEALASGYVLPSALTTPQHSITVEEDRPLENTTTAVRERVEAVRRLMNTEEEDFEASHPLSGGSGSMQRRTSLRSGGMDYSFRGSAGGMSARPSTLGGASAMEDTRSTVDGFDTIEDLTGRHYHRSDRRLGAGATCDVWLGMARDDNTLVALKSMRIPEEVRETLPSRARSRRTKPKDGLEKVLGEVQLLSELRHNNIVSYYGCGVTTNCIVIVTEYVSGGSLSNVLTSFGTLPEPTVRRYLREILQGLAYLHANDVVHCDIKPHNVLVMIDGRCKLTDFGASAQLTMFEHGKAATSGGLVGTPLYMSPEACRGVRSKASDVWSLGIVVAELLLGSVPYTPEDLGTPFVSARFMYRMAKEESFMPTLPAPGTQRNISASMLDFIGRCLVRDEAARAMVQELLRHPIMM
eukprot:PhM_4_TR2318/c0_g1_i1/m.45972